LLFFSSYTFSLQACSAVQVNVFVRQRTEQEVLLFGIFSCFQTFSDIFSDCFLYFSFNILNVSISTHFQQEMHFVV